MAEPLEQLTQAIAGMRDIEKSRTAATTAAFTAAMNQISAGLADVVALLERPHEKPEKPEPLDVDALARAFAPLIKGLPVPQVTVQPAQVTVTAPPANVTVQPAVPDKSGQQWRIEIERSFTNGPITALVVTRK